MTRSVYSSRSPLRPTTTVCTALIAQSASTMTRPASETSRIGWNCPATTPWSTPPRTRAGKATPATASRPSRSRPASRASATGRSSRRSVNRGSGARATSSLTSGRSCAGGSASTLASSSGVGGSAPSMPRSASRSLRAAIRSAGRSLRAAIALPSLLAPSALLRRASSLVGKTAPRPSASPVRLRRPEPHSAEVITSGPLGLSRDLAVVWLGRRRPAAAGTTGSAR